MKKLLTAACLLISCSSFGQILKLYVRNTSPCTVYYSILVSVPSTSPTCAVGGSSAIIAIPPGASQMFCGCGSPAVPGVTGYRYILGAKVLDGSPACATTGTQVGECGSSTSGTVNAKDATCAPCSSVNVNWNSFGVGTSANLDFN